MWNSFSVSFTVPNKIKTNLYLELKYAIWKNKAKKNKQISVFFSIRHICMFVYFLLTNFASNFRCFCFHLIVFTTVIPLIFIAKYTMRQWTSSIDDLFHFHWFYCEMNKMSNIRWPRGMIHIKSSSM